MFGFNSEELFSKALMLEEPWYVSKVEFKDEELHMNIEFKKGYKFKNKSNEEVTAHDTIEKTWRHLNFFQYKAYIHCKVPRIKSKDGINMVEVPWSRAGSGFTLLFESLVLELSKAMPVKAIARIVKEYDTRIWRILNYYVVKEVENAEYSEVTKIGIDETSVVRHNYITIGVDLDKSRVINITEKKDIKAIDRIARDLEKHKCKKEQIKVVTSDMSDSFRVGIANNFKNAVNIFDKFHVVKLVNKALDDIRKKEVKNNKILKKSKYLLLKNRENLKEESKKQLDDILANEYLETAIAYQYKLQFQEIYNSEIDKKEAKERIKSWIKRAHETGIKELRKVAKSIGMKIEYILNYFEYRVTNATLEGINSMIQMAKSRARGFRNIENFKTIIYLTCGKLDIKVPHYSCDTHMI